MTHYIEIHYPGVTFDQIITKEVPNRDRIKMPTAAHAYRFFDKVKGKRTNESPMHFSGKVYTLDQVKAKFPNKKRLIRNMVGNEWNMTIHTTRGTFKPFDVNDIVV